VAKVPQNQRHAFQALRSELNIVCDTTTGRDLSERSELSRLNVEQLQCFMNGASACGFLSALFLCPNKERGHSIKHIYTNNIFYVN